MNELKQSEIIKQLTNPQLRQQLFLSQGIFIFIGVLSSVFLFDHIKDWVILFTWDVSVILLYGLVPAVILVVLEIILSYFIDPRHIDDGGINERIFKSLNFKEIFFICIFIAVSEELLFRGVIQTTFGYIPASIIFALVHVRYLSKPVLLVSVLLISFFIGYLFEMTGNLNVTILAHFTVDFVLGIIIRYKK